MGPVLATHPNQRGAGREARQGLTPKVDVNGIVAVAVNDHAAGCVAVDDHAAICVAVAVAINDHAAICVAVAVAVAINDHAAVCVAVAVAINDHAAVNDHVHAAAIAPRANRSEVGGPRGTRAVG